MYNKNTLIYMGMKSQIILYSVKKSLLYPCYTLRLSRVFRRKVLYHLLTLTINPCFKNLYLSWTCRITLKITGRLFKFWQKTLRLLIVREGFHASTMSYLRLKYVKVYTYLKRNLQNLTWNVKPLSRTG